MSEDAIIENSKDFPGEADGYERLWTPHRMVYVNGAKTPGKTVGNQAAAASGDTDSHPECPFCEAPRLSDEDALIIYRGEACFVLLNLFPYNPGHLLICPYRHVADYTDLTDDERDELGRLTAAAMVVGRAAQSPKGFNLGMNQGVAAGAGIAAHLHQHIVPRWTGDSNFFPIIAKTKAMPEILGDTRAKYAKIWAELDQADKTVSTTKEGRNPSGSR